MHDPADGGPIAGAATLFCAIVDAMTVLVAARGVQSVTVGAVGQRRSLVADRLLQHRDDRSMQPPPFSRRQLEARRDRRVGLLPHGGVRPGIIGPDALLPANRAEVG